MRVSLLDRLAACQIFDPSAYLPFHVAGYEVGLVRPAFAARLAQSPRVFRVTDRRIDVVDNLGNSADRSCAVADVLRPLADEGIVPGWRDEPYVVAAWPEGPELMQVERAAVPLLGLWASGVHVNGFVRDSDGLRIWVGRRSPHKPVSPNKLDQLVAGGRSAGYSVLETVIKESEEEAGIDAPLAAQAIPVSALSYCTERPEGLRRDIIYVYDLELPASFRPTNRDGEIVDFYLWPSEQVIETARNTDDFKFNCSLVNIDFLIRHGCIGPEDPDYLALVHGLRSPYLHIG